MLSTEFLITSFVVVIMPGTGVIYTVSTGLFRGWQASIAAALGCTLGIVPHLLACIMGLSALLHTSALAFRILKYAGALYLLYLAWSMWCETGAINFKSLESHKKILQIAVRGFLINILNPKLSIFFLAFLPLFVSPEAGSPLSQLLLLSAVFMGMTLVVFILYGIAANRVSAYVTGSSKAIIRVQRVFAGLFAALGVKLMMAEQ